jgi:ParB family chromosome partitioning protein
LTNLKKPDMAKEAERLLAGTGWLPEPLRTTDAQAADTGGQPEAGADPRPAFLADGEEDGADDQTPSDPEDAQSPAVATE